MAYSRWVDSRWYVYWSVVESGEIIEDQVVKIFDNGGRGFSYSFGVLEGDLDYYTQNEIVPEIEDISKEDIEELKEYLYCFLEDVRENFDYYDKNNIKGVK